MQSLAFKYFVEVAEYGSLSAAAEKLGVAISAVSRQVSMLEERVGTALFDRGVRGMALTEAGALLLQHARRQILETDATLQEIARLQGMAQNHIRIACTQGLANQLVPKTIAGFQKEWTDTTFDLWIDRAATAAGRVADGNADIAITFSSKPIDNVAVRYVQRSPALAVMSYSHPLASRKQLSLQEIKAYPVALTDHDTSTRKMFEMACNISGIQIKPALNSNYAQTLHSYVRYSEAVLFASYVSVVDLLGQQGLVAIPLLDKEMHARSLQVQVMKDRLLPPVVEAFITMMIRDLEQVRLSAPV